MRVVKFGLLAALLAIGAFSVRTAHATTPYSAGLDGSENMEADSDTYTPTDNDPLNDAALAGYGPGQDPSGPAGAFGSAGEDTEDIRVGAAGVFEEVPNGHLSNFGNAVVSPDGSAHFAIVQNDAGNFIYTRTNRDIANNPSGPGFFYGLNGYMATMDLYIDPAFQGNGYANGIPDFWTTYSVNETVTNGYMTEAGTQIYQNGAVWDIHYGGQAGVLFSAPVGTWVGIEMEPIARADGGIDMEIRVTDPTHTIVLASETHQEYTLGAQYAQLAGPRNNVPMLFNDGTGLDYIFVDNVGWVSGRLPEPVPEPTTLVLAGIGAVGLVIARRRRS